MQLAEEDLIILLCRISHNHHLPTRQNWFPPVFIFIITLPTRSLWFIAGLHQSGPVKICLHIILFIIIVYFYRLKMLFEFEVFVS